MMNIETIKRLVPDIPKEWINSPNATYRESRLIEHLATTRAENERLREALESIERNSHEKITIFVAQEALAAKE